jgi:membrane protease YdiL (CAAX protease family)
MTLSEHAVLQQGDWSNEEPGNTGATSGSSDAAQDTPVEHPAGWRNAARFIFLGPDGLRPGWGLLLFVLIVLSLAAGIAFAAQQLHPRPVQTAQQRKAEITAPQTPKSILIAEGISLSVVALATWIMGRIERRPIGRYGFGGQRRLWPFVSGLLWGFAFLSVLVGALWKARLLVFDGRLLFGAKAIELGAVWLFGFLLVGFFEESLLRGYLQYTLSRGIASLCEMLFEVKNGEALGFWIAALLLSFFFGASHGNNPGESPIGLVSAGLVGAIFCLTLWKTGSLWWALGFHAAWDWAQSFVFGVADSGMMVRDHLFGTHPVGKILLSGGATGPEGSALVLPVLAVVALVVVWTLPGREWAIGGKASA